MRRSAVVILGAALAMVWGTASAHPSTSSGWPAQVEGQEHVHGPASGIAHGIPRICAGATVTTAADGAWSSAATWSTGRVPGAGDKVLIRAGARVLYDAVSDAPIACIDVEGALTFRTTADTRLTVGTITVFETGRLDVGSPEAPIPADVTAEIVVADQPIDTTRDPEQLTGGIIGLGTVRMHGAVKTPTFSRVAAEPLAGQTTLRLEQPVSGWKVGDKLVVPDTRQLKRAERGSEYVRQWEELQVAAVSGDTITLSAPLAFTHRGARSAAGDVEFLPHVGNVSRNVIVRSANAAGTRGHVIFVRHPDVDIRYALFKDLGRTKMGVLHNTEFNNDGTVRRVGTNQIGRYSIHFHHAFGPRQGRPDGYQFTLIGNAVDDASKWGVTIHNSHYGLIRDNVVYNSRGAAIVTEDGNESFNVFEHNFAMRSEGSGEFAPRSGYGGATNDPGGEGAAFWFRGPNNIVRNNVGANVDVFGYGIAAGSIEEVRVPAFKGADTTRDGEYTLIDAVDTPLLEFTGNEAYGAILNGVALGWNGTISNMRVWHASRDAVAAFPADRLAVDRLTVRGDAAVLADPSESPTGVWFSNYSAKSVTVRNADVQAVRVGVASPFFPNASMEPGRGDGVATIENSFFRNYVGVAVATAYTPTTTTAPIKKAVVRNSRFEPLPGVRPAQYPAAAISMNYGMSFGDTARRDPIIVYDFNGTAGDTFRVFYSLDLPAAQAPPCHAPRPDIGGFVCTGDDATQETRR